MSARGHEVAEVGLDVGSRPDRAPQRDGEGGHADPRELGCRRDRGHGIDPARVIADHGTPTRVDDLFRRARRLLGDAAAKWYWD